MWWCSQLFVHTKKQTNKQQQKKKKKKKLVKRAFTVHVVVFSTVRSQKLVKRVFTVYVVVPATLSLCCRNCPLSIQRPQGVYHSMFDRKMSPYSICCGIITRCLTEKCHHTAFALYGVALSQDVWRNNVTIQHLLWYYHSMFDGTVSPNNIHSAHGGIITQSLTKHSHHTKCMVLLVV